MDQASVESALADLNLPGIRFFSTIDSTNDEAWRWVDGGAPHGALVVADEQSAGRGRGRRRWVTVKGSALAFSLVLQAPRLDTGQVSRFTGLGALAACQALNSLYSLPAQVKWPNDILLDQRKAGGVLVEAQWSGGDLSTVVIGVGINNAPDSLNPDILSKDEMSMPATCVETVLGHPVDRLELLHSLLQAIFSWLPRLASPEFIRAWENRLAYRQQWVDLSDGSETPTGSREALQQPVITGKVVGLSSDGSLQLLTGSGELITSPVGEIHLRPAAGPSG